MRHLAIPALALACLALQPARASACSPVVCPERARVVPDDGATGVPTNTEVHVVYWTRCGYGGECASAADVRLREAETGTEIALEPAARPDRLRPVSELAPRTMYEILDRDWSGLGCDDSLEALVIGRFTTGDGPDLVRPSIPTGLVSGACSYDHCNSSACCGPYEATSTTVTWELVEDEGPNAVGYVAAGRVVYGNAVHLYTFSSPYPGAFYPRGGIRSSAASVSVVAIDLAGNESAPSESATVNLGCYPPSDGGLPDAGSLDAGSPSDASRPPTDASAMRDASAPDAGPATRSAGGCSVTHARSPSCPVSLLGLAVLALRARARRRSTRPLRRHTASCTCSCS